MNSKKNENTQVEIHYASYPNANGSTSKLKKGENCAKKNIGPTSQWLRN